jgi:hypothetical protein
MHSFRQRPLTWLFWIETACLDVIGALRVNDGSWFNVLLMAQLYVISGWAAVGKAHRLARGGLFIAAPLAVAFAVRLGQRSPNESTAVLAFSLMLSGIVWASTACVAALDRLAIGTPNAAGQRWQISIAELLGWTIVAAIASAAASSSKMPPLEHVHALGGVLLSAVPAGAIMALFLAPIPRHDRASTALITVVFASYFAGTFLWSDLDPSDHAWFAAVYGYIALWILVVRLDEQA